MSICVLAQPYEGTVFVDIGVYKGLCDPEVMIYDSDFVDWEGRVARHFVPVDHYLPFMDGGEELYKEAFKEFTHFAWFEYQGDDDTRYEFEEAEFWIDKDNALYGQWLLLLYCNDGNGKYHWFNTAEDAQVFFVWLASENIQGLIHDANKLKGSKFPRSHASQII